MAGILSSTTLAKSPFECQEMNSKLQKANRKRISSIQRKRVPRIDSIETMRNLERNNSTRSCSTSNSLNIILPLTSSDLEIQNTKQKNDARSSSFSSESRHTFSDDETVGPSTPRIILTRSDQEEEQEEDDDLIYLATHSTYTSKTSIQVEEEVIPFHQLPQFVKENPTTKFSWARRTPTHAVIETYMPPTCTACLSDLEEKKETRKLNRKKVPILPLSSLQLAQSDLPPAPTTPLADNANNLHGPNTGDIWGIAI